MVKKVRIHFTSGVQWFSVTKMDAYFFYHTVTSGGYRTKHGQAIRTEFIEEFVLPDWTCSMYANSSMNSVRIA